MAHVARVGRVDFGDDVVLVRRPNYQAFRILQVAYVLAPLFAGADKFFHYLVDWTRYLAPIIPQQIGLSRERFMLGVGVVEMLAALLVAVVPRIGGWVVGFWLLGIIGNLILAGGYWDIALRDFGLALGAFALARLGRSYTH